MFVFSFKADKRKLLLSFLCAGVLLLGVLTVLLLPKQSTAAPLTDLTARDTEERIDFLRTLGYEALADTEQVREVRIPDDPDDTLTAYNALQQKAGMDLIAYCGKRVKLYTYDTENGKDGETLVAHLYVYRDKIVAGDIAEKREDGAMHALGKE